MTAPHIGNYGVNNNDEESEKVQVSGFIIKQETLYPSNRRSEGSIGDYLKTNNITGIYGCDLMVDNEKYIIKVIRKRNEADGDGVEGTEGVHENEGEVSLDSNVTDKNQIILYLS